MNARLRASRRGSNGALNDFFKRIPRGSTVKLLKLSGRYYVPKRSGGSLDAQLAIAPGTTNCTLRWERRSVVRSTGPAPSLPNRQDAIIVGDVNADIPTSGTTIVTAVAGSSTITMPGIGTPPDVGKWYFLYDKDKEETNGADSSTRKVGGEIVKVVAITGSTITLDNPITQTYSGIHVILADIDNLVCQNITIQGGTFTGLREWVSNARTLRGTCRRARFLTDHLVQKSITEKTMSCTNIRTLFVLLVAAFSASSRAVVVFQDDLEGLIIGKDVNGQEGWLSESYINQFPAVISGPSEGITPASGGKMLKIRTSITNNGSRDMLNGNLPTLAKPLNGKYRYWSATARAFVRESGQEPISFRLSISAGLTEVGYTSTFNLQSGVWTGRDRLAAHSGTSNLIRGQWNRFQINVDWQTLMCSTILNGVTLGSLKFDLPNPNQSNRHIALFAIGTVTNADLSTVHSYPEGAQPVYVDDYVVSAVPEPTIGLYILSAGLVWRLRRK